jgi:hypothetical protein
MFDPPRGRVKLLSRAFEDETQPLGLSKATFMPAANNDHLASLRVEDHQVRRSSDRLNSAFRSFSIFG